VEELRDVLGRLARERAADPGAQLNWVARRLADERVTAWIRPDHHASEAVAAHAGLAVTDETRTSDKHEHIERLWRRRLRPRGLSASGLG
jgi:hypothetical protein